MINKILNIKISKKDQKIIYLSIIFFIMLVLNFLTPLIADDFSYSFGADGQRIANIWDIVIRQIDHWLTWGGRNVAHFIANFFLMYPKAIFNVLNATMYTLLVYLIYKHSQTTKEEKPILLVLINLLLYFVTPVFGQNCIWLIGSCNYLWTIVIILSFLLMYRENYKKKDTWLLTIGMFFFGVIAGWSNENTGFGLIVIAFLSMLAYKGKNKLPKYKISGLLGTIAGFVTMICAPGNYIRNNHFVDESSFIVKIIKRTIEYTSNIYFFIPILVVIAIILISIYIYKKKKIDLRVWIYLIAAFLTIYSMEVSPIFPERAWFGTVVFMLIAITTLLYNIESINKFFNLIIIDTVIILSLIYAKDVFYLAVDINALRNTWEYRINYIEECKKNGQTVIEMDPYVTENKKSPHWGLNDLREKEHEWPNDFIEAYFEVDVIKAKSQEQEDE